MKVGRVGVVFAPLDEGELQPARVALRRRRGSINHGPFWGRVATVRKRVSSGLYWAPSWLETTKSCLIITSPGHRSCTYDLPGVWHRVEGPMALHVRRSPSETRSVLGQTMNPKPQEAPPCHKHLTRMTPRKKPTPMRNTLLPRIDTKLKAQEVALQLEAILSRE